MESKRADSWKTIPTRRRIWNSSVSDMVVISWPKTLTEPESGRTRPLAIFMRTDLPLPAGPRRQQVSPGSMLKEMFSRTLWLSKAMETLSKTRTGPLSWDWSGWGVSGMVRMRFLEG